MTNFSPLVLDDDKKRGDFFTGILDVLVALGCALADSGALERSDIAEAMAVVLAQQNARDGGEATAATQFAPMVLRQFFSRQVATSAVN